jgi:hypothetical protein
VILITSNFVFFACCFRTTVRRYNAEPNPTSPSSPATPPRCLSMFRPLHHALQVLVSFFYEFLNSDMASCVAAAITESPALGR